MSTRTRTAALRASDDEDEVDENLAEQVGKGYTASTRALTAAERQLLLSLKRPERDNDEQEFRPLPSAVRALKDGAMLVADKIHALQDGLAATCVALSPSANVAAMGCHGGELMLLNPHTLETLDTLRPSGMGIAPPGSSKGGAMPPQHGAPSAAVVTAVGFRPETGTSVLQNVMLVATGSRVLHLHAGTHKVLSQATEKGNNINAMRIRHDGAVFATAGSDHAVRVYDDRTGQLQCCLDHGDDVSTTGHSNDVFSVAWVPEDPQLLVSAGWDRTVLLWDLRLRRSVRSIFGPYVCGDALDVHAGEVLTGSWRKECALQLWDLRSSKLLTTLGPPQCAREAEAAGATGASASSCDWDGLACQLYAAQFGPRGGLNGPLILSTGSGKRPVTRVYRKDGGHYTLAGTLWLPSAGHSLAHCVAASQLHTLVACAGHIVSLALPLS